MTTGIILNADRWQSESIPRRRLEVAMVSNSTPLGSDDHIGELVRVVLHRSKGDYEYAAQQAINRSEGSA
jgi:hypothetical protein